MSSKRDIAEILATEGRVEAMVCNIARSPMTDDLRDLCQIVYLAVLEYDEDKIVDLWDNGQINFFLARVIINQFRSTRSQWYKDVRKLRDRSDDISKLLTDEAGT